MSQREQIMPWRSQGQIGGTNHPMMAPRVSLAPMGSDGGKWGKNSYAVFCLSFVCSVYGNLIQIIGLKASYN